MQAYSYLFKIVEQKAHSSFWRTNGFNRLQKESNMFFMNHMTLKRSCFFKGVKNIQ